MTGRGELFGYGACDEADTSTHWFRSQEAHLEAIISEVFFHWISGQSGGPALPLYRGRADDQRQAVRSRRPCRARELGG